MHALQRTDLENFFIVERTKLTNGPFYPAIYEQRVDSCLQICVSRKCGIPPWKKINGILVGGQIVAILIENPFRRFLAWRG